MTKIDLITGFLGSGKTTFLKQYLRFLIEQGLRVCVLEFDYGAVNVDMMLLQEFNDAVDLEMVAGGCDYDCHLRRFKTKLISMGMKKYDRVIIEPSGLFDTDEFFDTLCEEPLDSWFTIGSVITIVDSGIDKSLSKESRYVLSSQIASSNTVILSKTQNHTKDEIQSTIEYLNKTMKEFDMELKAKLITKQFDEYTKEDYEALMSSGYSSQPHIKMDVMNTNSYSSLYYLNTSPSLDEIKSKAKTLFSNDYGKVMRIKGFIHQGNEWLEFNMTKEELNINPLQNGQDVIIVIGENLQESAINTLFVE